VGRVQPGKQHNPCHHRSCDTYANVNLFDLDVNSDAVAYATLQYAMNLVDINSMQGKGNFPPPAAPSGTPSTGTISAGGLHDHDHETQFEKSLLNYAPKTSRPPSEVAGFFN
jgi:hypothetical protein